MIIEQLQVTSMVVYCYLIADKTGGTACLIDPAGDYDLIIDRIRAHDLTVDWIINTHGHWDHTSGNEYMSDLTGVPLLIHRDDALHLNTESTLSFSEHTTDQKSSNTVMLLQDGDRITFGDTWLDVIHTPGHSPGCICLHNPGNVFTGDTLFTEGYGRTDLPGGSTRRLIDSIKHRILSLPDSTVIWPGHNYGRNPTSTVAEQKEIFGMSRS